MAEGGIDWVRVDSAYNGKKIGAVGFVDDKVVIAVSFFEDADWNQDGKIGTAERIGSLAPLVKTLFFRKGRATTEVLMAARGEPDVMLRDSSFSDMAARGFMDFATPLVFDGLYLVYFSRSVKLGAAGLAQAASGNVVKQYVVRKGMEKLVKRAYDAAVKSGAAFN